MVITRVSGSKFLRLWGFVLVAVALVMGPLSIFTFGAVCFTGLFGLWLKEFSRREIRQVDIVNGMMLVSSIVWFVLNIVVEFSPDPAHQFALMAVAFIFPPLILHLFFLEANRPAAWFWRALLIAVYVGSLFFAASVLAVLAGFVSAPSQPMVFLIALSSLFGFSGLASAFLVMRSPTRRRERNVRQVWRVNFALLLGTVVIFVMVILAGVGVSGPRILEEISGALSVLSRALPVIFLFFNSYYEDRFSFFDVFVKRATLFFILLAGLVFYFGISLSLILNSRFESWVLPWIFALTLLPLVMMVPWLHRRLEDWLDRHWLGRSFSTIEAVRFFLEGLQQATTREDLIKVGTERFEEIFQAPVVLAVGEGVLPGFRVVQRVPIGRGDAACGEILLGARPNEMPYFAEDVALATALSDVFWFLLLNQGLQERKQQQENRERELMLDASRSELKALRAQINPHFLFNALNVIAGLVHMDPDRAEATVEQLAEVFRYTLSRSDQEWVRVADEVEFIQSYLAVEKARFGERFEVSIRCDPEAGEQLIPTMMLQTLVENAVKHGVGRIKGRARLEMRGMIDGDRLILEVRDNGPGLVETSDPRGKGMGYGLKSVRHRLEGYYGHEAFFEMLRDPADEMTVARLVMPRTGREERSRRTS